MRAEVAKPKLIWRIVINVLPEAVIIVRAVAVPDDVHVTRNGSRGGLPEGSPKCLNFGSGLITAKKGEGHGSSPFGFSALRQNG
jgi:hypothetical protein